MSADNNHFMNREIQALQQEESRQDAKAELILALLKEKRETKMSVLRKASLPTLVSVAAIAGVFYVAQPKVVAATPDRVIKAIQDIKNYTIKSFTINGNERHLQSKTTVNGKDRHTVYYDNSGKEVDMPKNNALVLMHDTPMQMGFKVDLHGDLKSMSKEDIDKMKSKYRVMLDGQPGTDKGEVRVEVKKGPNGKEEKHYFVNGKEVDKLPGEFGGHIEMIDGGKAGSGKSEVRVEMKKGGDGKETKHVFVNGKEVDSKSGEFNLKLDGVNKQTIKVEVTKGPDGKEVTHYYVNGKEVDKLPEGIAPRVNISKDGIEGAEHGAMIRINDVETHGGKGVTNMNKSIAMVGKNGEKPMIVQSGQTSADYLVNLLKDTTKWTIERGVTYNGQRLDKFTLKGPVSPIVLYVDPATALPKVLRFGTPVKEDMTIEDVYEYGIQP